MDTNDTQHKISDTPTTVFSGSSTLVGSPSSPLPKKAAQGHTYHELRIVGASVCLLTVGWGDGATGAVLPSMQAHFDLNFAMAAMLFTVAGIGFALATFLVDPLSRIFGRFCVASEHYYLLPAIKSPQRVAHSPSKGRHLSLLLAGFLHCIYFLFAASSPRYYGVLIAFFLGGIGKSILMAQMQATIGFYTTHMELLPLNSEYWTKYPRVTGIALLHGTYGVGSFFSPLLSQTIRAHGYPWRGFFWISLGLAVLNVTFSFFAFYTTEEEFSMEKNLALASDALSRANISQKDDIECAAATCDSKAKGSYGKWHILCMPYIWVIAAFLTVYQGAETTAQGFIVTFLLDARHADPNVVGYALSGFWFGLTLARCAWDLLSPHFRRRAKAYYVSIALAFGIALHAIIWQLKNIVADIISVALLGLLVGPTVPLVLDIATNKNIKEFSGKLSSLPILPADVQPIAMAIGSSAGALGGAIFPLAAGIAATNCGAYIVEPLALTSLGTVLLAWLGVQIAYETRRM